MRAALIVLVLLVTAGGSAQETEPGQVQLPLDTYNQLVDASRTPRHVPRPVPAAYAIGTATVNVSVTSTGPKATGDVTVEVRIRVFEDEWSSVPVLPSGTAVQSVSVNGQPVQLVSSPYGLIWGVDKAGAYNMSLVYRVDAIRSDAGFALPVPIPEAAATNLTATLPGSGLDVAVIPGAGIRTNIRGSSTVVTATVPTSNGVQITWRTPSREGHSLSRARYTGSLAGDAVTWSGELSVEVFSDETVTLSLLPRTVTLRDVRVDGNEAPILVEGGSYATHVKGRGRHQVTVSFQVPVVTEGGPPRINLTIPQVPVSRFDLTLPGRKEVTVSPKANVSSRSSGGSTVATIFVPMGTNVSFSWAEAVPEAVRAEIRANAAIYHTVHAEEGVLYVQAMVVYEVSRGETNLVKLSVPPEVQVNRVVSPSGAVADWRITGGRGGETREISVFLDRMLKGELLLQVVYDRSLADEAMVVPLLRSVDAQRERGMVALLSSKELTLRPVADGGATRVGENQLPAFVRDLVEMTVAHTFKYVELPSQLTVEAVPPERKQGRFDAQVDTLITLEEVTMRGSASIEINVKSGGIMELELGLPENVNLLSLTGPSLRTHSVEAGDGGQQKIAVHFTQEMEGQFRIEVAYERIMVDAEPEVEVPTLMVAGAEVAQGRLAIEAKSAVEVQDTVKDQLTKLDINQLPQQLVLRTTNPILLAFKYVHAEPPHRLVLKVTRHKEVTVQEAAIDQARYRTLFTSDGLAVTTARFVVRNSSKQFLRLQLPRESEVWSAFVDGKPEKPAQSEDDERTVLIKIVTSTRGFPVQLIYATRVGPNKVLGKIRAQLPRPDILVTRSAWDVYLPVEMSYGEVSTNMNVVGAGVFERMQPAEGGEEQAQAAATQVEPLRINVPTSGIRYSFEKLYANQGEEEAEFSIPYASRAGARVGKLLSIILVLLLWFGVATALRPHPRVSRDTGIICAAIGAVLLAVTVGYYNISVVPAVLVTVGLALVVAGVIYWRRRFGSWQEVEEPADEQEEADEPEPSAQPDQGDGESKDTE
jgi:hypothetical protein